MVGFIHVTSGVSKFEHYNQEAFVVLTALTSEAFTEFHKKLVSRMNVLVIFHLLVTNVQVIDLENE